MRVGPTPIVNLSSIVAVLGFFLLIHSISASNSRQSIYQHYRIYTDYLIRLPAI
jgi:hypothetical protein